MVRAAKPKSPKKAAKPKFDDKAQSERFAEAARELGIEETGETFERAFGKVAAPKQIITSKPSKESPD
jgi:hypothetical protein